MKGLGWIGVVIQVVCASSPTNSFGVAAVVDFLEFTLTPSGQYFDAGAGTQGEFSINVNPSFQLFSMQSPDLAVAVSGVYTSYVQTAAALLNDSSSGEFAAGTFDSQSSLGDISTLTIWGAFVSPGYEYGSIAAPELLLVAEAIGPATSGSPQNSAVNATLPNPTTVGNAD